MNIQAVSAEHVRTQADPAKHVRTVSHVFFSLVLEFDASSTVGATATGREARSPSKHIEPIEPGS